MWHTIQSSLPELLAAGFKYTIPLALVSFFWGLLIALFVALIRLSRQNGAFKILKGLCLAVSFNAIIGPAVHCLFRSAAFGYTRSLS